MLTRSASTYFGDSTGEEESTSVNMADEGASKIDPENIVDIKYDDLPEELRQAFEAQLKQWEEEARRKLISCYERNPQGVIEREKSVMPVLSSTTSSTSMSNVSDLPSDFVKLMDALAKKYDESQQFIQNSLIGIGEKIQSLEKGEWVDKSYSTKTLNPSSSAAPTSTSQSLYSMPSVRITGVSDTRGGGGE